MGPNGIASHLLVLFRAACMPWHTPLLLSDGVLLQQIGPSAVVSCPPGTAGVCRGAVGKPGGSFKPAAGLRLLLSHGCVSRALGWLLPGSATARGCQWDLVVSAHPWMWQEGAKTPPKLHACR